MVYSDPISVLHQLVQRRDVEFTTRNPLSIKFNCCSTTCTAPGYVTKHQKVESFAEILDKLEKHHKIVSSPTLRVICPVRVTPCTFCSDPSQSVMPEHVTRRLPRIASVCGMTAVSQICHYWSDGNLHHAVGTLCCDQNFSLSCDSKPGLLAAFETYITTTTHYINGEGNKGIHVKLHPTITNCPLCKRQL